MHGFGIARRIEQITQNVFKVNAGLAFNRTAALWNGMAGWMPNGG